MAKKYMGWEGEIYYGPAGVTAPTKITNSGDITYELDFDEGDTTERGDGTAPPIETMEVTVRKISALTLQMLNKEGDTTLAALLSAASSEVDYGLSVAEVISQTQTALNSGDATLIEGTKNVFALLNERGCPLN